MPEAVGRPDPSVSLLLRPKLLTARARAICSGLTSLFALGIVSPDMRSRISFSSSRVG